MESEKSNIQLDTLTAIIDIVDKLQKKLSSSEFLIGLVKSLLDQELISDISNLNEYLQEIKKEINEIKSEVTDEVNSSSSKST